MTHERALLYYGILSILHHPGYNTRVALLEIAFQESSEWTRGTKTR